MKKIFHWLFTTILICSFSLLASCVAYDDSPAVGPGGAQKSIVILYENDVHCAIEGYTRMAGLRDAIADADTSWTAVVCSGDFLQGGNAGALSHGKYIIDIMRNMNYDAITLGNHEFDYGGERMKQLLAQVNAPMVCANFFDAGAEKPFYAPYTIKDMGSHRVAFVGVTTP